MKTLVAVCLLVAGFFSSQAFATITINFDDLEIAGQDLTMMSSYSNSGFTFTDSVDLHGEDFVCPQKNHECYYGSASLASNSGEITTLTYSSGAFSIYQMDVHAYDYLQLSPIEFRAYSNDMLVGQLTHDFNYDRWHWQAVSFDSSFENITSLQWSPVLYGQSVYLFDNLVLSHNSIPEPSTWIIFTALLAMGFVFFLRCKR